MQRLTRYSIRSLLVLMTLVCAVLGWYLPVRREYDRQQLALGQLSTLLVQDYWKTRDPTELMRHAISRRGDGDRGDLIVNGLNGAELRYMGPDWLGSCLAWCDHPVTLRVKRLEIKTTPLGDDAIPLLSALKTLETLSIEQSLLTPEGESRLRSLLPDTAITLTPYVYDDGT